jgi:hypothetical protein
MPPDSRLLSCSLVAAVTIGATVFACGGDDGGKTNMGPDAKVYMDARVVLDAPGTGSGYMGLGQPCTPPMQGSGQGDCPSGYICLNLNGASHPWCSKPCNTASDTCAQGYTGPGVASCLEQITFGSGTQPIDFCGITCAGVGVNGCTAATCTGACPGQMTCTATLTNTGGSAVGSACN